MVRLVELAIHFPADQIVFMILYTEQRGCVLMNLVSTPLLDYIASRATWLRNASVVGKLHRQVCRRSALLRPPLTFMPSLTRTT
jgi:hypothetical protein